MHGRISVGWLVHVIHGYYGHAEARGKIFGEGGGGVHIPPPPPPRPVPHAGYTPSGDMFF